MKTISFAVLVSFVTVSGLALAAQSGEQIERSTTTPEPMMQEMMKEGKQDMMKGKEGGHMGGMMGMMKMMEQCRKMMESAQSDSGDTKQKKM